MKKISILLGAIILSLNVYSYPLVKYYVTESKLDTIPTITEKVEQTFMEGWLNDSIVVVDTFHVRTYNQWIIVEYDNSGKEVHKTKIYKDVWHDFTTKYTDGYTEIVCFDLNEHQRIIKTKCNYEIIFLKEEIKHVPYTTRKVVPRYVSGYFPITVYDTIYETKIVNKCVEKTREVSPIRLSVNYKHCIYSFNYIYYDQFQDENGYWRLYIKTPDYLPFYGQLPLESLNVDGIVMGGYLCTSSQKWDHKLSRKEIIYEVKKYFSSHGY